MCRTEHDQHCVDKDLLSHPDVVNVICPVGCGQFPSWFKFGTSCSLSVVIVFVVVVVVVVVIVICPRRFGQF